MKKKFTAVDRTSTGNVISSSFSHKKLVFNAKLASQTENQISRSEYEKRFQNAIKKLRLTTENV